jgi:hypothetical protein
LASNFLKSISIIFIVSNPRTIPEGCSNIATEHRASSEAQDHRTFVLLNRHTRAAGCGEAGGEGEVKISHDAAHGVISIRVVSLVEDYEADIQPHMNVAMAERVKEYLRCGNYNAIVFQHSFPQGTVSPLLWFKPPVD